MVVKDKSTSRFYFLMFNMVLLILYILLRERSEFFTDLLSALFNISAGLFILFNLQNVSLKMNWRLIALMPFSWALADLLWFYFAHFLHLNPDDYIIFTFLYMIANLVMVITVIVYFVKHIAKWHRIKLLMDILVMMIIVTGLASALIFSNVDLDTIDLVEFIGLVIYMTTDLLTASIVLVLITSTKLGNVSRSLYIVILSFGLYFYADLIYAVEVTTNSYMANSLSDIMFLGSFFILIVANYVASTYVSQETIYEDEKPENLRSSSLTIWLAVIPLVLFIFGQINLSHFAIIAVAIIVYQFIVFYINRSTMVEIILRKEQRVTEELEALVEDRTRSLMNINKELTNLSIKDELTGLYNRHYFVEGLTRRVENLNQHFSVLFMDLDRFKIINDVHGHPMGDRVLAELAQRFKRHRVTECVYYRVGGDEFALIVENDEIKALEQLSQSIIQLLEEPIVMDEYQFYLGISIGIARFPKDARTVENLMKYSDIAMYHAKNSEQKDKYILYSSNLIEQIERRNLIELLLKNADFDRDFALYYQPKFDTLSGELIGMEALLRWFHHELGFISPGEFIPIAEEAGLILDVSYWVFNHAFGQIKKWNLEVKKNLVMSVNVSPLSLDSIAFIPRIQALIYEHQLDPNWIEFEITENSALNSAVKLEEILTTLSGLGVWISIDDFGTGYSSLSYIKRYDVDILKIAKELIDNITTDNSDHLIVKAIIMMAKGMGLQTVAEGVETKEQFDILLKLGCDAIQGYYLGKPMPSTQFYKHFFELQDHIGS